MELLDILTQPFMLRALYAGILVSIIGALLGTFITLKKQSFLTDGIAHASLAGIAVGLVVGVNPVVPAIFVAILMSLTITYVYKHSKLSSDVIIGILYSVLFALGIIVLNLSKGYQPELFSFLFGSILAVTWLDLIISLIVTILALGMVSRWYNQLVYMTFDREAAMIRGVRVDFIDYIMNALSAVAIVVAIKLVGVVLVTALFIIPATTAKLFAKKFSQMIPLAICFALFGTLFGVISAYFLDVPVGATIVVSQGIIFFIAYIIKKKII